MARTGPPEATSQPGHRVPERQHAAIRNCHTVQEAYDAAVSNDNDDAAANDKALKAAWDNDGDLLLASGRHGRE